MSLSAAVCVSVCVLCRMKCLCQSPSSPSGPLLINCPSSSCDSDHFNQDSRDTQPLSHPCRKTPLLPCCRLPACPSLAKIRRIFSLSSPTSSFFFFFSSLTLAATNNLTSAPHSPCHRGIMSLCGREVLEQRQGGPGNSTMCSVCTPSPPLPHHPVCLHVH